MRFTWCNPALMVFLISLLGMLDHHGISKLVFFLFTRVSSIPYLCISDVFKTLCGFVSIGCSFLNTLQNLSEGENWRKLHMSSADPF